MNISVYEKLVQVLNRVPEIASMYQKKDIDFEPSVQKWLNTVESILKEDKNRLVAETAASRALIDSSKRGIVVPNVIQLIRRNHTSKRSLTNEVSLRALYEVQHSVQELMNRFEEKYERAEQLARKIVVMASVRGILNARLSNRRIDSNTIPALWKDFASNESISPFTTQMLEIFDIKQALIMINKILDELIGYHKS